MGAAFLRFAYTFNAARRAGRLNGSGVGFFGRGFRGLFLAGFGAPPGFAFLLLADDPDFDVGLEVGGEGHGDGVGVDAAEGFVEFDVVGVDRVAELGEFLGDVAFADGAEEVAFVVGVADEGDFDALEGLRRAFPSEREFP